MYYILILNSLNRSFHWYPVLYSIVTTSLLADKKGQLDRQVQLNPFVYVINTKLIAGRVAAPASVGRRRPPRSPPLVWPREDSTDSAHALGSHRNRHGTPRHHRRQVPHVNPPRSVVARRHPSNTAGIPLPINTSRTWQLYSLSLPKLRLYLYKVQRLQT